MKKERCHEMVRMRPGRHLLVDLDGMPMPTLPLAPSRTLHRFPLVPGAVALFLLMLSLCSLYACSLAQTVEAAGLHSTVPTLSYTGGCGQSRTILLRYSDGKPAPSVKVVLAAAVPEMGGPELYLQSGRAGRAFSGSDFDVIAPPVLTADPRCSPVLTGTLDALTDRLGYAHFEGLGEGTWILRFEGAAIHEGTTAPIVPPSKQGMFPYGRTRSGGGFIEYVGVLNEEGGPNSGPVQPGVGSTTSRYLLQFSPQASAWVPGVDLAPDDAGPTMPFADVPSVPVETPTPATTSATIPPGPDLPEAISKSPTPTQPGGNSQEFSFDGSRAEVVPEPMQATIPITSQNNRRWNFSGWWAVVLGLVLGGALALVWAKRGSRPILADTSRRAGQQTSGENKSSNDER